MILDGIIVSLKVVTIAVLITFLIALFAAKFIDTRKNKLGKILEFLIILPMFIPPSAIGYLILLTLGRNSFLGNILEEVFDISIIFTITAAIIAAVVVTIPIMYQSIKNGIKSIDKDIVSAAKVDGAGDFEIFVKIIIPLASRGIISGILLSFARAFGEFGATILVAGNIPGKTQTLPMALYYTMETNNTDEAMKILIIILAIGTFLMSTYSYISSKLEN